MDLYDYFYKEKKKNPQLTITQWAKTVGCSRQHMSNFLNGACIPSLEMAKKISDLTNGTIKPYEIIAANAIKKSRKKSTKKKKEGF